MSTQPKISDPGGDDLNDAANPTERQRPFGWLGSTLTWLVFAQGILAGLGWATMRSIPALVDLFNGGSVTVTYNIEPTQVVFPGATTAASGASEPSVLLSGSLGAQIDGLTTLQAWAFGFGHVSVIAGFCLVGVSIFYLLWDALRGDYLSKRNANASVWLGIGFALLLCHLSFLDFVAEGTVEAAFAPDLAISLDTDLSVFLRRVGALVLWVPLLVHYAREREQDLEGLV